MAISLIERAEAALWIGKDDLTLVDAIRDCNETRNIAEWWVQIKEFETKLNDRHYKSFAELRITLLQALRDSPFYVAVKQMSEWGDTIAEVYAYDDDEDAAARYVLECDKYQLFVDEDSYNDAEINQTEVFVSSNAQQEIEDMRALLEAEDSKRHEERVRLRAITT